MWDSGSQVLSNASLLTWGLSCGLLPLLSPGGTHVSWNPFLSLLCPGPSNQEDLGHPPAHTHLSEHPCSTASFLTRHPHHLLFGKPPHCSPGFKGTYISNFRHFALTGAPSWSSGLHLGLRHEPLCGAAARSPE